MNTAEAMKSRYTCRDFKPDQIDKKTLLGIMDLAMRSPSWGNTQPWEIYIAAGEVTERLRRAMVAAFKEGKATRADLPEPPGWPAALEERRHHTHGERYLSYGVTRDDAAGRKVVREHNFGFFGSPVVAFLCMDRTLTPWSAYDLGAMSHGIMLAAQEYGLDSAVSFTYVTYPDIVRKELGIPDDLSVIIGISLGYGKPESRYNQYRTGRRPVEEAVHLKGV